MILKIKLTLKTSVTSVSHIFQKKYNNDDFKILLIKKEETTLKKTNEISSNLLVLKCCGTTVSSEFWATCSKLYGNCAFPQNFHTRKLGEISVFLAVPLMKKLKFANEFNF